jgi:hypothetical protein
VASSILLPISKLDKVDIVYVKEAKESVIAGIALAVILAIWTKLSKCLPTSSIFISKESKTSIT